MTAPTVGSLFAGYDGIGLAVERVLGARRAWFSEYDPKAKDQGAARILAHHWPDVPNHGDLTAIDWSAVEPVDIITGGFPCQDLSLAGKQAGMAEGTRSGLWSHMAAAIETIRPRLVVAENVRGLLSGKAHSTGEQCEGCVVGGPGGHRRALGTVLGDLACLGYDAQWVGLRASDVGAPHQRFRVVVVAHLADAPDAPDAAHDRRPHFVAGGSPTQLAELASDRRPVAPENAHGAVGRERREPAPGQEEGGRARADTGRRGGVPAADADNSGWDGGTPDEGRSPLERAAAAGHRQTDDPPAPDSDRDGRGELRRLESVERDTDRRCGENRTRGAAEPSPPAAAYNTDWGQYAAAVHRWETALGRSAPRPTETGPRGGERLSPQFVEWMMGLPAGHVTDPAIGITRAQQLKALGNGVVPQQIEAALYHLLAIAAIELAV